MDYTYHLYTMNAMFNFYVKNLEFHYHLYHVPLFLLFQSLLFLRAHQDSVLIIGDIFHVPDEIK